ncbi:MAG TPA: four helix bundle protein [Flavisolibacter sp.]|nr:four helix bundle protein [Flavisolibacter sp.]
MPKKPLLKNLELYDLSKKLVISCYALTHDLPESERTNFTRYIRSAALQAHLSIARKGFGKSKKRKKPLAKALQALVVIDAAIEILVELGMSTAEEVKATTDLSAACRQLLDQR